jgi:hypothetical protein
MGEREGAADRDGLAGAIDRQTMWRHNRGKGIAECSITQRDGAAKAEVDGVGSRAISDSAED